MTTARFTMHEAVSLLGLSESPASFFLKCKGLSSKFMKLPVLEYEPTAEQRSAAFWLVMQSRDYALDTSYLLLADYTIRFAWNVVPARGRPYKKILKCGLMGYSSASLPASFHSFAVAWSTECVYETDVPSVQRVVMLGRGKVRTMYRYDGEHPMCAKLVEVARIMGMGVSITGSRYGVASLPDGENHRRNMLIDARVAYNILTQVPDLTDDQNTAQYDRAKYEFVKGYLGEDIARKYFRRVFDQLKCGFAYLQLSSWAEVDSKLILRLYEAAGQELTGFGNLPVLGSKYLMEFWLNQIVHYVRLRLHDNKLASNRYQLIVDTRHLMEDCKKRKLFTWRQLRDMSRRERLKRFHDLLSYAIRDDDKRNAKKKYGNVPDYQYNDLCVQIYNTVRDIVLKYDPTATVTLPPSPLYIVCMGIDQKHCVGSYVEQHGVSILILDIVWHGNASACGIDIAVNRPCSVSQWLGVSNSTLTPETDSCVAEIDSVLPAVYSKYKPLV